MNFHQMLHSKVLNFFQIELATMTLTGMATQVKEIILSKFFVFMAPLLNLWLIHLLVKKSRKDINKGNNQVYAPRLLQVAYFTISDLMEKADRTYHRAPTLRAYTKNTFTPQFLLQFLQCTSTELRIAVYVIKKRRKSL